MSSEIIPVQEDNATSSRKEAQHQHSSDIFAIQPWDLLDHRKAFNVKVSAHLAGGDYHTKQYLASRKGHKYVNLFNPTLESVKPLLDKIKEPSLLLLRGCELLLQSGSFPFDKFKSITVLEISGCPHLTTLPENTISQMNQLQCLNLSYLQINHLPHDLFQNKEYTLRSLVIRCCSNLHVLPKPSGNLIVLKNLDLSYLPIKSLSSEFSVWQLRTLILRGCSELQFLELETLVQIQFLDLCHCTSLIATKIATGSATPMVIDLSYTAFNWCNLPDFMRISHLFFRNANLCNIKMSCFFTDTINSIKVCDLSGNQGLGDVSDLKRFRRLEALNLSRTAIQSIEFLSKLTYLRTLVLGECTRLKQLPTVEQLEDLEVLDLSGCAILCGLPQGLSKQRRLKELNLCGCKSLTELVEGLFDDMPSLEKLDLSNTDIKNLPSFDKLINRGTIIKLESSSSVPTEMSNLVNLCSDNVDSRRELHLVSNFICNSGFEKFQYKFTELNHYLSLLEEKLIQSVAEKEAAGLTKKRKEKEAAGVKMQFESLRDGLEYILDKLDLLESSQNCRSSEELLHQLMSYDYNNHDNPSSISKKLLRTVAKLKLLVPPLPPKPLSVEEGMEELTHNSSPKNLAWMNDVLRPSYESLTPIQRNCLLYFACLANCLSGYEMIKKSTLIYLWYGEGFFDSLLRANSTNNPVHGMCSGTIAEIGQEILQVLEDKRLITADETRAFMMKKAMEEHSFDFNECGKLTPQFSASRRACLLKSDTDHPPSSQIWLNYTKSSEKLESFKTVRTLLYIDELVVDINTEWFSAMTNLHVLHLANLCSEQQINIVDLKFLEELKNMKQLRLLNLDSFAIIQKLPNSICELTNLRILNLAYCSNMTELPAGIASLTNLIILDLTQCHLLPELPKGLASLSKLEVLKGFPITYEVSGKQSRKACTLRELLKLESLRKLNLVVNRDSFPDTMDLQVLRNMKELRNLKITWKQNIYKEEELGDAVLKGALRQSRWKQIKCWGAHNETEEEDYEVLLTNTSLRNLNKLVLCCVPFETEPNWLHPAELQNLKRMYIVGGSLRTLFQENTDQIRWNVKTLKLKYLSNLDMDWLIIKGAFPCLTSCDQVSCPHAENFLAFYLDLNGYRDLVR